MVGLAELIVILEPHRQGMSVSAITRRTGLHRSTVRRYITRGIEPPAYGPRPLRPSKLTKFQHYLRERLAAFPELTGSRLHREIRDLGYSGGYDKGRITTQGKGRLMEYRRISIDTSKHVFTIHSVDGAERPTLRLELRRSQIEAFFAKLAPTEVALEACGGAHHWGRRLSATGHRVKLIRRNT